MRFYNASRIAAGLSLLSVASAKTITQVACQAQYQLILRHQ